MNAPQELDFDKWHDDAREEPHVLSEQELADIETFLAREWPQDVIGDYPEELITHQANFAPSLIATVRELQRQVKGKAPADWLDPEELNERIGRAVAGLEHARGFLLDLQAGRATLTTKQYDEQIERLDHGISALTGPSK